MKYDDPDTCPHRAVTAIPAAEGPQHTQCLDCGKVWEMNMRQVYTTQPRCQTCRGFMTSKNASLRPELFLHDACLPDKFKPTLRGVPLESNPTLGDVPYFPDGTTWSISWLAGRRVFVAQITVPTATTYPPRPGTTITFSHTGNTLLQTLEGLDDKYRSWQKSYNKGPYHPDAKFGPMQNYVSAYIPPPDQE